MGDGLIVTLQQMLLFGTASAVVTAAPGRASAGATDPCGRAINCTLPRATPAGSSLTGVGVNVSRASRPGIGAV